MTEISTQSETIIDTEGYRKVMGFTTRTFTVKEFYEDILVQKPENELSSYAWYIHDITWWIKAYLLLSQNIFYAIS